jgi:hypothetical protein
MNRPKPSSLMIGLVLALAAWPTGPAVAASMPKGTVEVSASMLLDHFGYSQGGHHEGSTTNFALSLGAGPCLSNTVQVKAALEVGHNEVLASSESTEATSWGGTVKVGYNFTTTGATVPYVDAGVGVRFYSGDAYDAAERSALLPVVSAGVRCLLAKAISLNTELSYQRLTNVGGSKGLTASGLLLGVGFSFLLEPGPGTR